MGFKNVSSNISVSYITVQIRITRMLKFACEVQLTAVGSILYANQVIAVVYRREDFKNFILNQHICLLPFSHWKQANRLFFICLLFVKCKQHI